MGRFWICKVRNGSEDPFPLKKSHRSGTLPAVPLENAADILFMVFCTEKVQIMEKLTPDGCRMEET
jgi:hypothetical protein